MKKIKMYSSIICLSLALFSCGNNSAENNADEEIVIGDTPQKDSSVQQAIADKIEQIDPALAKQAAEKLNEYSSKSKVDLSKIGAGDKDITMRKKRFYYNEDGTIISFSSILHEDIKKDYAIYEKIGSSDPTIKLAQISSDPSGIQFKGENASAVLNKNKLTVNINGSEKKFLELGAN